MIRIVLCRPEYQINLGMIARIMENFDCSELYLVSPTLKIGFEAVMFAKYARTILDNAKICSSLPEALVGCKMSIGTSGALEKYNGRELKNCITLKQAVEKTGEMAKSDKEIIALVFGAEGNGMSGEELSHCSLIANIPTSKKYPSINLANSVSIALYEFYSAKVGKVKLYRTADPKKIVYVEKMFSEMVDGEERIKEKAKVKMALKRVLERAIPENYEIQSLLLAFSKILRRLKLMENKQIKTKKGKLND